MNVILDTNIWISFLFGKRLQSVSSVFENTDVHVFVSKELIAELVSVIARPKVRNHITAESIEAMWALMRDKCFAIEEYPIQQTNVRDVKDAYVLSMAKAIPADFIVTGDQDLLVLDKFEQTYILSYSEFLQVLSSRNNLA